MQMEQMIVSLRFFPSAFDNTRHGCTVLDMASFKFADILAVIVIVLGFPNDIIEFFLDHWIFKVPRIIGRCITDFKFSNKW